MSVCLNWYDRFPRCDTEILDNNRQFCVLSVVLSGLSTSQEKFVIVDLSYGTRLSLIKLQPAFSRQPPRVEIINTVNHNTMFDDTIYMVCTIISDSDFPLVSRPATCRTHSQVPNGMASNTSLSVSMEYCTKSKLGQCTNVALLIRAFIISTPNDSLKKGYFAMPDPNKIDPETIKLGIHSQYMILVHGYEI